MNFILIYFSGTGNSALISAQLGQSLAQKKHSVELISIEDRDQIKNVSFANKIIGFGFPVYKFTYPEIFNDLFSIFNTQGRANPYFLYCTYARFTADVFYDFGQKLDRKKYRLIAERSFKSPSNGISARLSVEAEEYKNVMFFEDAIVEKIDAFVCEILHNLHQGDQFRIRQQHDWIGPLRLKIVTDIERTKYPRLQIDPSRCHVCGLCVLQCPDKNLEKSPDGIKIIDSSNCLHCLRCMHHCPKNAISFGKLTQGDNRYTFKTRNMLFEKSASGHKEACWADFYAIRSQWRRDTIRYWLKYRRKPELG